MQASRLLRCDAGHKRHPSSSFCFRSANSSPMKNYNFGWGPNFLKTPSSSHFDVLRPPQKRTCCPDTKMPHQNSLLDILLFDSGQSCVDLSPIENYNFRIFSMGPKLYRVTIFFGSHVPNFLEAPSCSVLMFSDLQGRLHVFSHAQDASRQFKLHSVLSTSNQHCIDLSPMDMENYSFRWGPNFLIESPSSLVHMFQTFYRHHLLCFCCFPTCSNRLPVLRMHKTPRQNLGSIAFFLIQVNTVSI